jgi:hypothetical protein
MIIICKWSKPLDFLGKGKGHEERVLGCDVSKDYIILHDGSQAYKEAVLKNNALEVGRDNIRFHAKK